MLARTLAVALLEVDDAADLRSLLAFDRREGADPPGALQGHGLEVKQASQLHLPVEPGEQIGSRFRCSKPVKAVIVGDRVMNGEVNGTGNEEFGQSLNIRGLELMGAENSVIRKSTDAGSGRKNQVVERQ